MNKFYKRNTRKILLLFDCMQKILSIFYSSNISVTEKPILKQKASGLQRIPRVQAICKYCLEEEEETLLEETDINQMQVIIHRSSCRGCGILSTTSERGALAI